MSRLSSNVLFESSRSTGDHEAHARARRSNRRRLLVFASVFVVLAAIGLVYDFARPAIYEASSRLDFLQNAAANDAEPARGTEQPYALRDEVQYLTSRTLLTKVWDDLKDAAPTRSLRDAADPPATLQSMLTATQVPGTNIVLLQARGPEPAFLAAFVDRLVTDYRAGLVERFRTGSATTGAEAGDAVQKLASDVLEKRREVDAFRARYNIVSLERDENEVLSAVKGAGTSLNAANDRVVMAEAKLAALTQAQAAGGSTTRARDDPALASLEQQAVAIRADLRATARQFTPEYMQIDPRSRELRARLAEIDEQLAAQRRASQQGALQEARDEVAAARAATVALRQQLASSQGSVQTFTSRFNEYRALQEQLAHLEQLQQKAADRVAVLDAGEQGRRPKVEVVEAASTPQSPVSPLYARDAALVLLASLTAALVAMGIVELFNRAPAVPSTVVVPQAWGSLAMNDPSMQLSAARSPDRLGSPLAATSAATPIDGSPGASNSEADAVRFLPAPQPLPRELAASEVAALLAAADRETRAAMALLLCGLTADEVVDLRHADLDRATAAVVVPGSAARTIEVPAWLVESLPIDASPAAPLFGTAGRPLSETGLAAAILYAAHDAGLDAADEVTPQTLRETCIAYLVRQGVRFADLAKRVGPLPAQRLAAYRLLVPDGPRVAADAIEFMLPAVRDASAD